MAKYSESIIEEIKSKLRLSEVIGSYVSLKRQGSTEDYKACCPFHHDKTPSFIVHDDKGFYKCFGCQKSGNMFTFLMDMDHLTFSQAVEELAKKAHVELQEETAEQREQYNKQKSLGDLYNRICISYNHLLNNSAKAQNARNYIAKRKISAETAKKFMLGYAPDDPNWLYSFLHEKNYSDELFKNSGLFSRNHQYYSLFRNRILFPVRTWQGNCVAFSGRDLSGQPNAPKYVNSPETSIYSKRNVLFGFYESLPTIKQKQEIYLCEGNFDVISLHQASVTNACAPLGTAFTPEQAALIKRYCNKVKLLFDNDEAGRNATVKAILLCQTANLECEIVKPFINAKDASQVLEEQGEEELAKAVINTEPAFSYLVHSSLKLYDTRTPKGKLSVLKEVCPYLDATNSDIERQGCIKYLSEVLHTPEEVILSDYKKRRYITKATEDQDKPNTDNLNPLKITPDLNSILLVFNNRNMFDYFRRRIKITDLNDQNAVLLYTVLEDCEREGYETNEIVLSTIADQRLRNLVFSSFSEQLYKANDVKRAIDESINTILIEKLLKKRQNIISLINSGEMDKLSSQEYATLLEAKSNLDKEIEDLLKAKDTQ